MTNFVQLQDDVTAALASRDKLQGVNVKSYRRMRLESEVDMSVLVTHPRNGQTGAGILVEMPEFKVPRPNLPGPETVLNLGIAVIEVPAVNMNPQVGTLLSAEEICQWVLDTLHGFRLMSDVGFTLQADADAIKRAPDKEGPGVLAYRITFVERMSRTPTQTLITPSYALNAGVVTLTDNNVPASLIKYTLDNSFPSPLQDVNPNALTYTAPFAVTSGQIVRWASFTDGFRFSFVGYKLIA